MTNDDLLKKLGNLIDAKLDEKLEPIKAKQQEQGEAIQSIKENMATKADMQQLTKDVVGFFHETWQKMDDANERVASVEEDLATVKSKN